MPSKSVSLYITQIKFCRALAVVRSLPIDYEFQPSVADKLNFYGLYKQAIAGDCMQPKPSSIHIVDYAKWKSWEKLRGISPVEAQVQYISSLISLLQEFLDRYPESELAESLVESLNYLQEDAEFDTLEDQKEDLVQWDTNEQETEEYYLAKIEKEQLVLDPQQTIYSCLSSPNTSSENLPTPELAPISPLLISVRGNHYFSPRYSQEKTNIHSSYRFEQDERNYNRGFIYQPSNDIMPNIATAIEATNSLNFSSHPSSSNRSETATSVRRTRRKKRTTSSSSLSSASDKAIHMLQTEVTALCQEIKSLQKNSHSSYKNHFLSFLTSWPWLWFIKSIAKHIFLNVCIFTLLFIVLRRRKSPIALAIVHHVGPRLKDFMHYLFDTTVFWKVTV